MAIRGEHSRPREEHVQRSWGRSVPRNTRAWRECSKGSRVGCEDREGAGAREGLAVRTLASAPSGEGAGGEEGVELSGDTI